MKDQKVNVPGISGRRLESRLPGRLRLVLRRAFAPSLLACFLTVLVLSGLPAGSSAQSINWSDPQSPILKAVVLHQRLASEREVGNILVLRSGRPFAGVTRMTLVAGDSLVTGDQTAIIGYADQSWEAVVHPNTQVDFRGGEVRVAFGKMFAKLAPSDQNLLPIAVSSNYGTITGGEGSFEIDVNEERAVITVVSGKLDLTRPTSEVVMLQELDEAVLIAEAPVVTRPVSTQRFTEVNDRISALASLGVVAALQKRETATAVPAPAAAPASRPDDAARKQAEAAAQAARNRDAQALLNKLGYDAGPPDGVAGPRTLRAVAAFRLDRQLPGATEIDDNLIAALRTAPPRETTPETGIATAKAPAKAEAPAQVKEPAKVKEPAPAAPAPAATAEIRMPDLIGLDFDQARTTLEERKQLIGRVRYQPDADAAPGTVLQQWPLPGDIGRQGGSVDLVIARAKPAPQKKQDDVMSAESVAAALGAPPPPPPPPSSTSAGGSKATLASRGNDFLGSKGYLGTQDDTAGLFRPEQKLASGDAGGGNLLSRDELSACLRIEDDYLAQKLRVDSSTQKQDATADEIAALDVKLDEMLPKTDPNKPETLEAYNTMLDQRLRLFSEYKDKILPEARQNERQLRAIQRSFQEDCGRRPYRAEDLEAARKEASLKP